MTLSTAKSSPSCAPEFARVLSCVSVHLKQLGLTKLVAVQLQLAWIAVKWVSFGDQLWCLFASLVVGGGFETARKVGFARRWFGEWLSLVKSLGVVGLVLGLTCATGEAILGLWSVCLVGAEVKRWGLIVKFSFLSGFFQFLVFSPLTVSKTSHSLVISPLTVSTTSPRLFKAKPANLTLCFGLVPKVAPTTVSVLFSTLLIIASVSDPIAVLAGLLL